MVYDTSFLFLSSSYFFAKFSFFLQAEVLRHQMLSGQSKDSQRDPPPILLKNNGEYVFGEGLTRRGKK
jgi:hypothetical protein